jgi:hypothetical protein
MRIQIDQKCYRVGKKLDVCKVTDVKYRPTKKLRRREQLHEGND